MTVATVPVREGMTLQALAGEVKRQREAARDFIVPSGRLSFAFDEEEGNGAQAPADLKAVLDFGSLRTQTMRFQPLTPGPVFHEQVGVHLGIPRAYYSRMMAEAPGLLTRNVNEWLGRRPAAERRMVRTIDNRARAFLSDRYRPLDNFDVAEAVLPALVEAGAEVYSCNLSERRMYLKATTARLTGEVKVNDIVQAGVILSNSEVGLGALEVQPIVLRLRCMNGLVIQDVGMKRFHLGKVFGDGGSGDAWEVFKDDTRKLTDEAFWRQVRDVAASSWDEARFKAQVTRLQEAAQERMQGDPVKAIEEVQRQFNLTDEERGSVLNHLIAGGDLTRWGLVNAVTASAHDVEYDRGVELETAGGRILEMPKRRFETLGLLN
jgi:hypothetical protein